MKIRFLTIAAVALLLSPARAQQGRALGQLIDDAGLSVPVTAVPRPDRGFFSTWDPSAPFSYHQRPAEVLARGGSALKINNVRWGALPGDGKSYRWETAVIMPERLESVYYGINTAGTGHSFLVFVFGNGGFINMKGEVSGALTLGAEPYTRAPGGYNRADDLLGRYPIVWNLTTLDNYADFTVNSAGSDVRLARLNLSGEARIKLLMAALDRMERTLSVPENHVLYSNNCTTLAVSLVNQVLPEAQRISGGGFFAVDPDAVLPRRAVKKYTSLGALSPEAVTLNSENYRTSESSVH